MVGKEKRMSVSSLMKQIATYNEVLSRILPIELQEMYGDDLGRMLAECVLSPIVSIMLESKEEKAEAKRRREGNIISLE
jgi:hypothetical protein